jgi:predicted secreted protein
VTLPIPAKKTDISALDRLTGGAFTAATSGERASRVREWLQADPAPDQLAEVFRELSVKDKGAAKLVRERIDEARRARGQDALAAEWAARAQVLLESPKINIADAMAWQRDAAKAGAPLSRDPLAGLKGRLADRVRGIEDLQHQVQVQREAAVLLAQRIEVLSTKAWRDAQAALEALAADVARWQAQADSLLADSNWSSVDMKFAPLLEASRAQLLVVWEAFGSAVAQAQAASTDPIAPLPPVPVWAEELRAARALASEPAAKPPKPKVDPEVRAQAVAAVTAALDMLELEINEGHGRASAGAAGALRQALKDFGRLVDDRLESRAHAALAAAGELESWQRWRADQIRDELVRKAEGLLQRPEGQELGGRKVQEALRSLREQWKQTDQGGVPNHAMWKRFDEACNEAHKVVEVWLEKVKAESAEHRAQRLALIEEVRAWAAENQTARDGDWKGFHRVLHQFAERWREGGHVGEKVFAELQPLWRAAIDAAAAPLEAVQAQSLALRQAMIEEAKVLGAAAILRVDAVKALQQRWQAQAHTIPLDRRQEQKLWDAFRKPIDEAFNRKSAEREKAEAALSARDRLVLEASKALDAANSAGDAQRIRAAMAALDAALRGQAQAQAHVHAAGADERAAGEVAQVPPPPDASVPAGEDVVATEAVPAPSGEAPQPAVDTAVAAPAVVPARKPVVAVRGDDRPGMRKESAAAPIGRDGRRNDRNDRGDRKDGGRGIPSGRPAGASGPAFGRSAAGDGARSFGAPEQPRLGDAAFRAQREALENAQQALRRLAAQAHGEALAHLMEAWEKRDASMVPSAQELGAAVSPAIRTQWLAAVGAAAGENSAQESQEALLRLEMAAELPTPSEHLNARRALQLQLLTRRNDPAPLQTWGRDAARAMTGAFTAADARRVQNALKVLLKR